MNITKAGTYHSTTLTRRFGGWIKALKAAGLSETRSPLNISSEELFQNMEKVWTKLGRQPRYNEFHKPLSKYSAGTYENRFGSWRNALKEFILYINSEEKSFLKKSFAKSKVELPGKHKTNEL